MKNPIILFNKEVAEKEERQAAEKYFDVAYHRTECRDRFVIPRYSALPRYDDLYFDLYHLQNEVPNNVQNFNWITSFNWYDALKYSTPRSWRRLADAVKDGYAGPFIVKGALSSQKALWATHCYAEDVRQAVEVSSRLSQDSLIGYQQLIYREYMPLRVLEYGINGLPFANEWRFLFWGKKLIDKGFYWAIAEDETLAKASLDKEGEEFAQRLANIASHQNHFFCLDIAQTEQGRWLLIEVNCGEQSGLSMIEPENFYSNLRRVIDEEG